MENSQILALVAVAIAVVSLGLLVGSVLNFQSSMVGLGANIIRLQQEVSANNQGNASQQAGVQQGEIADLQNRIASLSSQAKSLESRVAALEQGSHCAIPGGCAATPSQVPLETKFVPVALRDDKGNLWTSWFIRESLYYPTLYSTSCDAPSVDCYVHFSNISTPNGTGIEADTTGSNVYGYWFLGYSGEYIVPQNGTVTISGNFLKNDTFSQTYQPAPPHPQILGQGTSTPPPGFQVGTGKNAVPEGRSHIFVFILDRNPDVILAQKEAVLSSDNPSTWYGRTVTFNLPPGEVFRVGIGAENNWANDYHVYVAWNGVTVRAADAWTPLQ